MKDLRVRVGGDTSGFEYAMSKVRGEARKAMASLGGNIGSQIMGAVTAGSLAVLSRATMAYADDIEETSTRIGVSMGKLQEWSFAAKQSGASVEQLTRFIEQLSDAATDPKKNKILKSLGINASGMSPEQLFMAVNQFARGKSSTDVRSALGDVIDTRRLGAMMNFLQSDLDELGEAARKSGAVMDDQLTHQLAALNDQFSVLSQILYAQFGPSLLNVSKILLRSFAMGQGISGYLGAKTAGMGGGELYLNALLLGLPYLMKKYLVDAGLMKKDPNQKSFDETADKAFAEPITKMEELLNKMANWKPVPPPKIGDSKAETDRMKVSMMELKLDQLSQAGLFAGGAGKSVLNNIPEMTLRATQRVAASVDKTNQILEESL